MSGREYHRLGGDHAADLRRFGGEVHSDDLRPPSSETFSINMNTWKTNSGGPPESFLEKSRETKHYMNNYDTVDHFLCSVYSYFNGKGFTCTVVARALNLM